MKQRASKIRIMHDGRVLAGFAGSVADAFTLFERFEGKLKEYSGNLKRAAVELAKDWRTDKYLRRLEAMLIVGDRSNLFLLSGMGDVITPDDEILAIGSGGNYALAAARALIKKGSDNLTARDIAEYSLTIAADICPFTNHNIEVQEIEYVADE
jgi:ATP-dependent HslUV protease subunit HslV